MCQGKVFVQLKIFKYVMRYTHRQPNLTFGEIYQVIPFLRQYFPKGTRFDTITHAQLQRAVEELNRRSRKTPDYRTPAEVFNQEKVAFRV